MIQKENINIQTNPISLICEKLAEKYIDGLSLEIKFYLLFLLLFILTGHYLPANSLNDNKILYIYSAIPQIISALVGLLLAGYAFSSSFHEKTIRNILIENKENSHSIIKLIQKINLFHLQILIFISILCILTSLICIVFMEKKTSYYYLITNLSSALFVISLFAFFKTVSSFYSHKKIEYIEKELKDPKNNLTAISDKYDEIESIASTENHHENLSKDISKYSETPQYINEINESANYTDVIEVLNDNLSTIEMDVSPFNLNVDDNDIDFTDIESQIKFCLRLYDEINKRLNEVSNVFYPNKNINQIDLINLLLEDNLLISKTNKITLNDFINLMKLIQIENQKPRKISKVLIQYTLRAYRRLGRICREQRAA